MSVISVMPLTGFEPTMAMALAATVVKRKAMTAVRRMATTANKMLCITPSQKKTNVSRSAQTEATPMNLNDRSRCVRTCSPCPPVPPFSSFEARPTAFLIMPHERMMPMMPAMAMPPMPMLRA